jgi:hypothetical protein
MWSWLTGIAVLAGVFGAQSEAMGYTHNFIDSNRSSVVRNLYVVQGIEGSFGRFKADGVATSEDGFSESVATDAYWKGWGVHSGVGIELFKFLQFGIGHTMVNERNQSNSLEKISGSRFTGETSLNFASPMGSLMLGGGVVASRYDYTRRLESADYYGSGYFYKVGINYFIAPQVSVYGDLRTSHENLIRNTGTSMYKSISLDLQTGSAGFAIWL